VVEGLVMLADAIHCIHHPFRNRRFLRELGLGTAV